MTYVRHPSPTGYAARCREARCPSLTEVHPETPIPPRDRFDPWFSCAACVGGPCRLYTRRPDLTDGPPPLPRPVVVRRPRRRAREEPGQVHLFAPVGR
jgi:hypothetical protein